MLIQGETGTGKELVAHALQDPDRPFSRVNCGGITETIALSELFGHRKGAFTGADQDHIGIVQAAHGGTLFLDEVENLPMRIQEQLLEVLQEKQIRRLGETGIQKVDVRVLASTNIDLLQAAADGRFRKDLYYRLQVLVIDVPPLRKRLEDIPDLAYHFMDYYNKRHQKSVTGIHPEVLAALSNYDWPGNVRELKNMMNRAVLLAENGGMIGLELLQEDIIIGSVNQDNFQITLNKKKSAAEKTDILAELEQQKWNITKTAKALGHSRKGLRLKMRRLGLSKPEKH